MRLHGFSFVCPAPSSVQWPEMTEAPPTLNAPLSSPARAKAVRTLGRYQLLQLLGKSELTMAWRANDSLSGQDLVLVMPRQQPQTTGAMDHWLASMRRASRLSHPNLAAVIDSGVVDHWPYVVHDPRDDVTLSERMGRKGEPAQDVAIWAVQGLEGLAFAHEAGVAHLDLQPYLVLLSPKGQARLMGAAAALPFDGAARTVEAYSLTTQRQAAECDVIAFGLLIHWALAGTAALDHADIGRALRGLPPWGRDLIRLPFTTAQPVPEALRAIVNRATDRQERQRYRNARTLLRALQGWLKTSSEGAEGALSLLLDRLQTVGLLPASHDMATRAARLAQAQRERTAELADIVLEDPGLSLEMLRAVNTAQVRGGSVAMAGPVLTIRRAIAMLGLESVRRATQALRAWPGPLNDTAAIRLERQFDRVKRHARLAQLLRPAGYDPEVVFLVTLLQCLGRLTVHYHFPDEAQQIARLMQPAPSPKGDGPDQPGMSEEEASWAVLGTCIDELGVAIARHWGMDAEVQKMARRLSPSAPVRQPDTENDVLRLTASCGIEVGDALLLPADQVQHALRRVLQRYSLALGLTSKSLRSAIETLPAGASETAWRTS